MKNDNEPRFFFYDLFNKATFHEKQFYRGITNKSVLIK